MARERRRMPSSRGEVYASGIPQLYGVADKQHRSREKSPDDDGDLPASESDKAGIGEPAEDRKVREQGWQLFSACSASIISGAD